MANELLTKNITNGMTLAKVIENYGIYSSITADTEEKKAIAFEAVNKPTFKSEDYINKEFEIADIIILPAEFVDEETGEVDYGRRCLLINSKGESLAFSAKGIFSAIENFCFFFGKPDTWEKPKKVIIKQVKVKNGTMLTFEYVPEKTK